MTRPDLAKMEFRQQIPRPVGAEVLAEPRASFARLSSAGTASLVSWGNIERSFVASSASATRGGNRAVGESPAPGDVAGPGDVASPRDVAGSRDMAGPGEIAGTRAPVAAVLLALLEDGEHDGAASLALIRRAAHLRANPGEMAFPGGRIEPGEAAVHAALREASEEVGLLAACVRILGALPPATLASRPDPIVSFVGRVEGACQLAANPEEVDELIVTPLSELARPEGYWEEHWRRPGGQAWSVPFFARGDDVIWGASARILVFFFEQLARTLS
ncbi:MAG: NUDIX hydrolase [Acidimicrobiales bacterium]